MTCHHGILKFGYADLEVGVVGCGNLCEGQGQANLPPA